MFNLFVLLAHVHTKLFTQYMNQLTEVYTIWAIRLFGLILGVKSNDPNDNEIESIKNCLDHRHVISIYRDRKSTLYL